MVPSMRGGMRMPPNPDRKRICPPRCQSFNEGRHAHAAECHDDEPPSLDDHPSMRGGMRMPPNPGDGCDHPALGPPSMRGGMRMPPNVGEQDDERLVVRPSMRGGMRMPPNPAAAQRVDRGVRPSMRGGMRMPPNHQGSRPRQGRPRPFNEGRHAHAAESGRRPAGDHDRHPSMRGGMRMPPNKTVWKKTNQQFASLQ